MGGHGSSGMLLISLELGFVSHAFKYLFVFLRSGLNMNRIWVVSHQRYFIVRVVDLLDAIAVDPPYFCAD